MTPGRDRAAMAAIALGWLEEEVPEPLWPVLEPRIAAWREEGRLPLAALWYPALDALAKAGAWDAELSGCALILGLEPNQPGFRLRQGTCLARLGHLEEARTALLSVEGTPALRSEALLVLVEMIGAPDGYMDELEIILAGDSGWDDRHAAFIAILSRRGLIHRAERFLTAWTDRWAMPRDRLMDVAVAAMQVGRPSQARQLFAVLRQNLEQDRDTVLNGINGDFPAFDSVRMEAFEDKVLSALNLPEAGLAPVEIAPRTVDLPDARILMVSFGDRELPNDLVAHYVESARLLGLDIHLHADSALTLPREFRGEDAEVTQRIALFEDEVARIKPDVLLLDWASPLTLRGLNPGLVSALKRRNGIRVVGLMRDSHSQAMPLVRAWAPACDTLIADILSPAFAPTGGLSGKVVPLVVPAQWGPFLVPPERPPHGGMTFAGAVNFPIRQAILSVLLTELDEFRAITGRQRTVLAPDMAAYAGLLASSKGGVLNISLHTSDEHLVTGRVWETLACGGLLVEQVNPGTSRFLVPWRHYLPWESVTDLAHLSQFVKVRPDLAARVAAEGRNWAMRHYSPRKVWSGVLTHALRPRGHDELEAEDRAARDWSKVSFG